MHEICDIPLWQARECTVVVIEKGEAFRIKCGCAATAESPRITRQYGRFAAC
jgi:hypothetical protein